MRERLKRILARSGGKTVLVLGDLMLDEYVESLARLEGGHADDHAARHQGREKGQHETYLKHRQGDPKSRRRVGFEALSPYRQLRKQITI